MAIRYLWTPEGEMPFIFPLNACAFWRPCSPASRIHPASTSTDRSASSSLSSSLPGACAFPIAPGLQALMHPQPCGSLALNAFSLERRSYSQSP